CIKEGDEYKAAFKTRYGLFEPTVMFFVLTNSPATFQTMMNHIFHDVIIAHEKMGTTIRVYMDDIAIASRTGLNDHRNAVTDVLKVAEEHDLYFKPEKCVFHATSIDYLGVILEKGVTRMDPVKIKGVQNWPQPTTVTEVRAFVGFCNYYQIFIKNFAARAKPLVNLTKKDTPWRWTEEEQAAMDDLINTIKSEPVLAHPQLDQPFELEVAALGYAIGAVLMQRQEDKKRHPVAFFLKTPNAAKRNYDIYDLELLAIVRSLENWRTFLAGSPHKIKVFSDHMNLQYWKQPHKINRRVAREVLMLSEYNIEIHHIKGKSNGRADALSRRPDYDKGKWDNKNVVVLPNKLFIWRVHVDELIQTSNGRNTIIADNTSTLEYDTQNEDILRPWVDPMRLK